jgi:hypothetical protein
LAVSSIAVDFLSNVIERRQIALAARVQPLLQRDGFGGVEFAVCEKIVGVFT